MVHPSVETGATSSPMCSASQIRRGISMSFNNTRRYDPPKRKRILIGETLEEETARLAKEIAAHPVTKCEPGARNPSSSRPGWSSKPIIPAKDLAVAEGIAKKIMRKS
jgi:hypothetical protein